MQQQLRDLIYRYRTMPMYALRHRTRNPALGLKERIERREFDDMSDKDFDKMMVEVKHLANSLWHRQTTVHPDTLLGRLIIESGKDPILNELFCRYESFMKDDQASLDF